MVAMLGDAGDVDTAMTLLLPTEAKDVLAHLQDSFNEHGEALVGVKGDPAALSDGSVTRAKGRGLTGRTQESGAKAQNGSCRPFFRYSANAPGTKR
jgi:hypothetical protein